MENNVHFAHEHPLIFKESKEIRHCCNACGLYVLSSPCYMCTTQGCNFYLHQACANLPPESHHYFSGDHFGLVVKHSLVLLAKPRDKNCLCSKCGKLCENFIYHCSECEFVLHPLCGFPFDIQIKHISHPQHPLVIVCKKALLLCDFCGREHMGYFFSCHKCNFWIHHDCALLPSFVRVENHHHYLSLVYSAASLRDFFVITSECLICSKIAIRDHSGFYYCFTCGVSTHVDCAISHMKDSGAIFHLPSVSIDTFPSSMISALVKARAIRESNSTSMLEKYHAHSLVLIDEEDIAEESVCNSCIQPISPPYYRCSAHSECKFLLHEFCVDLPLSIKDPTYYITDTWSLVSPRLDEFFSLFECFSCSKYCNGFGYSYGDQYIPIVNDLECSFSPRVIEHDSHKQHPLLLSFPGLNFQIKKWVTCCGKSRRYRYHCGICQFSIHNDCALLPKTVTHKFDKHPLTLTFASSSSSSNTDQDLCEFCEEDIDSKYWFYHCGECDQSFHVDCIPSTGEYSKIKFGGSVEVPCHEDHPLRLTRMMNLGSQTCGYCHEIIKGFKDGMALHCQHCDFWIHFNCGYRSCGEKVSRPYSKIVDII